MSAVAGPSLGRQSRLVRKAQLLTLRARREEEAVSSHASTTDSQHSKSRTTEHPAGKQQRIERQS